MEDAPAIHGRYQLLLLLLAPPVDVPENTQAASFSTVSAALSATAGDSSALLLLAALELFSAAH